MVEPAAIPVGEFLYKSSLPTAIPATRPESLEPYVEIALFRASSSSPKVVPEDQSVSRRETS